MDSDANTYFQTGVLAALGTGLALFGYTAFLRKKSYLVEWRAAASTSKESTTTLDDELKSLSPPLLDWVTGTLMYSDRPIYAKDHSDIVARVAQEVQERPEFEGVSPEHITIQISHIHVL